MARIRQPNRNRTTATAALLCSAFAWPMLAGAQTWINPGNGNWFDPINWSTAAVPVAGGTVIVSNGGTATLSGLPATPVLGSLNIGLGGTGNGVGSVTSNGVAMNAGSALNIGTSTSAGAVANGQLHIGGGAGGTANNVSVGFAASSVPATLVGRLDVAGSFLVNGGNLAVGGTFGATPRGSVAEGVVTIGGNAGTVGTFFVGNASSNINNGEAGSRANGAVSIGGNMVLTGAAAIGTTDRDSVADAAAPGGFRFHQSSGTVNIGGTLSIANSTISIAVGSTVRGVVDGALTVGALDMPAGGVRLNVGTSFTRGEASGRFSAGSGDLRIANFATDIGVTRDGTAQGVLTLGGQLLGGGNALNVGTVSGGGTLRSQATGNVSAAGGVAGFNDYSVGVINGPQVANSSAQGRVTGGAAAPASNTNFVSVGNIFNGGSSNTANGVLILGNTLNVVNNGNLVAGQAFGAGRGSVANGVVNIGGDAGTVNFLVVGDVFSFNNDQVGSRATGAVNIGGNLTLTGFASVGTAFPPDRVADAAVPGGFRFNQASGTLNLGGTLSIANTATSFSIGTTGGGVVNGAMSVGTLDLATGHAVTLSVGNASSAGGQAIGSFTAGSGDLRTNLQVNIGTAVAGTAQGSVTLGGRLLGNDSGLLRVGTVLNPPGMAPVTTPYQGSGSVSASGGISGFTGFDIAALTGPLAVGSRAEGSVIGGSGAPVMTVTRFVSVGVVQDSVNAASANGTLTLGNSLNMLNRDFIAGSVSSAAGSAATAAASIAGDVGTVRNLLVGQSIAFSPDQVGSRATGTVEIGGNMSLSQFLLAGYTSAERFPTLDRVADAAAPGGFRVNQASGTIKIGGTLSIVSPASALFIGTTGGGIVDGSVRIGSMAMAGNTLVGIDIGTSAANGRATGVLEINGGTLRADTVRLGVTTGGRAAGRLALNNANLEANTVRAGTGGGAAQIQLSNSQLSVAQDMALINGLLGLERSRLRVGNNFALGNDALTHVEIDGLTRGTQYGTIDTLAAALDGRIEFDFGDLLFGGASAVFDILRSGSINGVTGDFDAFSFLNLAPNYSATAGIELDAGVEVYRVRLARINAVPEPASALLLLLGLSALATARGRKRHTRVTVRLIA